MPIAEKVKRSQRKSGEKKFVDDCKAALRGIVVRDISQGQENDPLNPEIMRIDPDGKTTVYFTDWSAEGYYRSACTEMVGILKGVAIANGAAFQREDLFSRSGPSPSMVTFDSPADLVTVINALNPSRRLDINNYDLSAQSVAAAR